MKSSWLLSSSRCRVKSPARRTGRARFDVFAVGDEPDRRRRRTGTDNRPRRSAPHRRSARMRPRRHGRLPPDPVVVPRPPAVSAAGAVVPAAPDRLVVGPRSGGAILHLHRLLPAQGSRPTRRPGCGRIRAGPCVYAWAESPPSGAARGCRRGRDWPRSRCEFTGCGRSQRCSAPTWPR